MLIFLYGPDSYRRQEKSKEYLERYQAKYAGFSLRRFYFDQDGEWEKFKDFAQAQSLFESSTGENLRVFLKKEIKARNLILDKASEDLLVQVYAGDSWGLITELDKLSLLDEKKITADILENHLN